MLTHAQGRIDAGTWADYMNVGMEHGCFDMAGLADYMRGMADAGPTRSGHRTPTVIVEAPVNGIDAAHVRYNAWQFRQILGRGVHGILLCQAETADAVRAFVESCRYPHNTMGVDAAIPSPMARMEGAIRAQDGYLVTNKKAIALAPSDYRSTSGVEYADQAIPETHPPDYPAWVRAFQDFESQ